MAYQHILTDVQTGARHHYVQSPAGECPEHRHDGGDQCALKGFQGKKDLKVVLFNAKGKCFSAGVDVGEHMGDLAPKMIGAFHRIFRLMDRIPVPTVASGFQLLSGRGV